MVANCVLLIDELTKLILLQSKSSMIRIDTNLIASRIANRTIDLSLSVYRTGHVESTRRVEIEVLNRADSWQFIVI